MRPRQLLALSRNKGLVGLVSLGDLATETGYPHRSGEVFHVVSEPSMPRR